MRKADAATPGEWARGQLMVVGLSYRTTSLESASSWPRSRSMVIDMDDLEHLCPIEGLQRSATVQRGEALASEETLRITRWVRVRSMTPAIVELRRQGEEIRALELVASLGVCRT